MAHSLLQRCTATFMVFGMLIACNGVTPSIPKSSVKGGAKRLALLDPLEAKISILLEPTTGPIAAGSSTVTAPLMKVQLSGAESYMVLRCFSKYMPESGGEDARTLTGLDLQAQKFVWFKASSNCVQLANNVTRVDFTDLTTLKDKEYFYILNPCVTSERSTSKTETCSYNLVYSKTIKGVRSELSKEFDEASQKLGSADARLAGLYQKMYYYAETIRLNQDTCEQNAATAAATAAFWRGITSILAIGLGAFVGGAIFGAVGQIQGAQQALGFARATFPAKKVNLDCPAAQEDADKASETMGKVDGALKEVIEARKALAALDASYAAIDAQIIADSLKAEMPAN